MTTAKKKTPAKKPLTEKKTSFSDQQYVDQAPVEDDIAVLEDGARYLPIDVVERDLDRWAWGTQNFRQELFKDRRGQLCIGASLELLIPWDEDGKIVVRTLVGTCNFPISSYSPNDHFAATAKSECVKNAASDLGKRFGRGLNANINVVVVTAPPEKPKMKPDKALRESYERADETTKAVWEKIYDFNTVENGNETI